MGSLQIMISICSNEGSHHRIYEKLGAHPVTVDGRAGTHFAVWAPNAKGVSLVCKL